MSESMQAVVVSGADRDKSQASVRLKLYNEDGSPFSGGGGDARVYTVKDLPEQDLESAAPLVLEIPVEAGDLLDIVATIEVRAIGDPVDQSPVMSITEDNDPGLLLTYETPHTGFINLNVPSNGDWFQIHEDIQAPDLNPKTWSIRSSGILTMTFALDIALTPVPVNYRDWRVRARHYSGGG